MLFLAVTGSMESSPRKSTSARGSGSTVGRDVVPRHALAQSYSEPLLIGRCASCGLENGAHSQLELPGPIKGVPSGSPSASQHPFFGSKTRKLTVRDKVRVCKPG